MGDQIDFHAFVRPWGVRAQYPARAGGAAHREQGALLARADVGAVGLPALDGQFVGLVDLRSVRMQEACAATWKWAGRDRLGSGSISSQLGGDGPSATWAAACSP
ncbi:hypothetical protein [Deinococcus humi]|uniref:Uncharacterized protein n=1 Tax=Deinococcus humi TaxID=662880 RepID=A0A7W8K1F8_9DEIO|nr:hypothetical protein [Deinococcus humi]MBB5365838.1 hypothetical protein [Deinococcus humi]